MILLVEDQDVVADYVRRALERQGYTVEVCGTGEDAIAKLVSGPKPDLILLDMKLPTMSGSEFLAWQRGQTSRFHIAAYSAYLDGLTAEERQQTVAQIEKSPDLDHVLAVAAQYAQPDRQP